MNLAFLIDPPEALKIEKDTSFALMLAAQSRGHQIYILERGDISLNGGKLTAHARHARVTDDRKNPFAMEAAKAVPVEMLDIVFIRTDPPFDTAYITDTWLLSQAGKKPLVLNSPHGLRTINEKIWAAQFAELTPATLITARLEEFKSFLAEHKTVVLKPTDGFGGSSVFVVHVGDKNAAVAFETLVKLSPYVIVQAYLTAAADGDKRILLLNGQILGAVLRYHSGDDHRNNFAAGGKARQTDITAADRKICDTLQPYLNELGIFLAGVDIIGGKLIEINVTSPTCLREMQEYYSEDLAAKIIEAAEGGVT